MNEKTTSSINEFSSNLESALADPNRNDFIQHVGAAIRGLGANGIIDDNLALKVCLRMRTGEK
ncbi:hypothetical protein [Desulfuromonas thiophila]|uniref:hypothetical protein n=1 Tax=Desulfuromonas thiophila TaxID=57664 RepID=UPI0024A8D121|nr:hypothetical protein [Desulfuromonas thiophila]